MAAKFQAKVKSREDQKSWYIQLCDSQSKKSEICEDLEEFSTKLTDMASEYDFDIEVNWEKDSNVTDEQFYEVHQQIAQKKEEFDIQS